MNSQDSGLSNETFCGGTPDDEEPTLREILAPFAAMFERCMEVERECLETGKDYPYYSLDTKVHFPVEVGYLKAAWEYLEKLKKAKQ